MQKKKNYFLPVMLLMLMVLATACGKDDNTSNVDGKDNSSKGKDDVFELKFTNVQPKDHPTNVAAEWAAEQLKEKTDGKVTLKVYPGGALGGPDENIAGMNVGDVDFAWLSSGDLARHIPEFNLFGVSYLIEDKDHFSKVAAEDSEMMKRLDELVMDADIGSRLVGMMGGSPRRLFNSKRSVSTPEDLKGLSIRIQDSPVEAKVWKALGAKPVPLAWDELYTGLQSGVVDGAEASTSAYDTNKFYEVASYHNLTDHQFMFLPVLMSEKTYDKLPEDLRI